jgi:hypothetical protein
MAALRDLTKEPPFDRLTVIERGPNYGTRAQWWCLCICGTSILVSGTGLVSGKTRSCGCLRAEVNHKRFLTHGMAASAEYGIWSLMKKRCLDPKNHAFPRYGGRGISVCPPWIDSFSAFYTDMGPRPSARHSLERRNNDGPYSPDNCIWATPDIQSRNTSRNRFVSIGDRTACVEDWLHLLGLSRSTFHYRVNHGMSAYDALITPKWAGNRRRPKSDTQTEQ